MTTKPARSGATAPRLTRKRKANQGGTTELLMLCLLSSAKKALTSSRRNRGAAKQAHLKDAAIFLRRAENLLSRFQFELKRRLGLSTIA